MFEPHQLFILLFTDEPMSGRRLHDLIYHYVNISLILVAFI